MNVSKTTLILTFGDERSGLEWMFRHLFRHFLFRFVDELMQLRMSDELDAEEDVLTHHDWRRPISGSSKPETKQPFNYADFSRCYRYDLNLSSLRKHVLACVTAAVT